ncbi:hypothetical protein [Streptomyces sp. B1I3]|nr:hypothetical protein [Streptomyces sp. B1I3]
MTTADAVLRHDLYDLPRATPRFATSVLGPAAPGDRVDATGSESD